MRKSLLVIVALSLLAVMPAAAQDKIDVPVWIAFTDAVRLGWAQDRAAEFNEMHPQYNVTGLREL
jgi:ABC-type glycerol-3-phosphate transport system substrate-binding protein